MSKYAHKCHFYRFYYYLNLNLNTFDFYWHQIWSIVISFILSVKFECLWSGPANLNDLSDGNIIFDELIKHWLFRSSYSIQLPQ